MHAASRAQVQGQEENMTPRPRHDFVANPLLLRWRRYISLPSYPLCTMEMRGGQKVIFTEIFCVIKQRCRRTDERAYAVLEAVGRDVCSNPVLASADFETNMHGLTTSGCMLGGKTLDDVTRCEHTGKTLATNKDGSQ